MLHFHKVGQIHLRLLDFIKTRLDQSRLDLLSTVAAVTEIGRQTVAGSFRLDAPLPSCQVTNSSPN